MNISVYNIFNLLIAFNLLSNIFSNVLPLYNNGFMLKNGRNLAESDPLPGISEETHIAASPVYDDYHRYMYSFTYWEKTLSLDMLSKFSRWDRVSVLESMSGIKEFIYRRYRFEGMKLSFEELEKLCSRIVDRSIGILDNPNNMNKMRDTINIEREVCEEIVNDSSAGGNLEEIINKKDEILNKVTSKLWSRRIFLSDKEIEEMTHRISESFKGAISTYNEQDSIEENITEKLELHNVPLGKDEYRKMESRIY
ncbi:hypothetical protein PRELSG_0002900 [Plasmodium relictum]|uniref:Gamete antigen 27/25 n=1 Tax=Plasmodium relictum TaxID=85471 RepID=A0A1J1GKJ5_PLARL|nr:hypothetical protein PRELSG_0002900 [Plasmodium relictum]CRG84699.1 hypothetical protein PRELSG_0002900 [Plasmodium relictum]